MARASRTQRIYVGATAELTDGSTDPAPLRFRALFSRHFSYVWTSLARLGVAERDREDVTHEVFLAVYRKLDQYDDSRPVRPWLFAFAAGVAADYRRLGRHRLDLVEEYREIASESAQGEDLVDARERRALVDAALAEVDDEKRAILVLHELDECPIPEVAIALGIPEGTAYSRLRAGREQFEAAVRRIRLRRGHP
jgi:RNA polymerase sigma-70 factor (ECF subfamily)